MIKQTYLCNLLNTVTFNLKMLYSLWYKINLFVDKLFKTNFIATARKKAIKPHHGRFKEPFFSKVIELAAFLYEWNNVLGLVFL